MSANHLGRWIQGRVWEAALVAALLAPAVHAAAAELQPRTVTAFERYVAATEAERAAIPQFLWTDREQVPAQRRQGVRNGELFIERLETRDGGRKIDVPDGLIHHWLGTVFVPGVTIDDALALLQDYDRHDEVYAPNVARSRLISRSGDTFRLFLRFYMKKGLTVVVDSEHEARFTRPGPGRAQSRIYSTRIAEVQDPDTAKERELPIGNDGGYLWRLNSYWRLEERDGGVYVQCESMSLTRGIPFGFGWFVRPFASSIPRETLKFTLETTRTTLRAAGLAQRR